MENKHYKILTINPGSTSTKIGVFDDDKCVFKTTIDHSLEELAPFKEISDQKEFRLNVITKVLKDNNIQLETIDAFSGRGGGLVNCPGGTYKINEKLYEHANVCFTVKHPATLGATISYEFGKKYNKPSFVVNPPDVDEYNLVARLTGIPEIYRESRIHALNQKEVANRYANKIGVKYSDLNLIVCHLGGGISIAAHNHGRMIDSNDNVNGDGPMTPTRSGFVPAKPLIKLCFSGKYTEKELNGLINKTGGLLAWLNTNDAREVVKEIKNGNKRAKAVYDAMIYQIAKQIGAMYVALKCNCSAILLTGGLSNDEYLVTHLKKYIGKLSKVVVMNGEFELEALSQGAIRVLSGVEKPVEYTGEPVFKSL